MVRWSPLVTAVAAFLLYMATMAHAHEGDTPVYVAQILAGDLIARSHMLPRPLGALAVAVGRELAPNAGPYPPLIALNALFAAASAALLHACVARATGRHLLAVAVASTFACTRVVWRIATTYEFPLFPLPPLLGACLIALSPMRRRRPLLAAALMGALQAVAFSFHAIAFGAVPGFALMLLLDGRSTRERALSVTVFLSAALVGVAVIAQAALWAFLDPNVPPKPLLEFLGAFAEPTLDATSGRAEPASAVLHGFGGAVIVWRSTRTVVGAWLLALVAGTWLLRREAWARFGGAFFLAPAWMAGVAALAIRVEASNFEYYAEPIAAAFLWTGLLAGLVRPTLRLDVGLLVAAALLAGGNGRIVLRYHKSADGGHVDLNGSGAQPNGGPAHSAPMNGGPMNGGPMYGGPMNGAPMYGAPMYGGQQGGTSFRPPPGGPTPPPEQQGGRGR